MGEIVKKIVLTELLKLIPENHKSKKYLSWEKLDELDFHYFNFIGEIETDNSINTEFATEKNYWSKDYPIALDYYPNSACKVYTDNVDFYLVYTDFGGHIPEKRCRLIRRELII